MKQWSLVKRKIADLKEHPKNPRVMTKSQAESLKASISKFGLTDKPVINTDNQIIGGHMRLNVLHILGYVEIECWLPNETLTQKEVDELNIRLNKNTGEWDWDCLANDWEVDDLVLWGFDMKELSIELPDLDKPEKEEKQKKGDVCPACGFEL